jgi:hypothetical protein
MSTAVVLNISVFDLGPKVRQGISLKSVSKGTLAEIPDKPSTNKKGKEDKDA